MIDFMMGVSEISRAFLLCASCSSHYEYQSSCSLGCDELGGGCDAEEGRLINIQLQPHLFAAKHGPDKETCGYEIT